MDDRRKILLNKGRSETYINKNVDIKIDIDNTARPLPVNDVDTKISAFEQSQQERSESTIYRFYGFVSPLISNPLYNDIIKIRVYQTIKMLFYYKGIIVDQLLVVIYLLRFSSPQILI